MKDADFGIAVLEKAEEWRERAEAAEGRVEWLEMRLNNIQLARAKEAEEADKLKAKMGEAYALLSKAIALLGIVVLIGCGDAMPSEADIAEANSRNVDFMHNPPEAHVCDPFEDATRFGYWIATGDGVEWYTACKWEGDVTTCLHLACSYEMYEANR